MILLLFREQQLPDKEDVEVLVDGNHVDSNGATVDIAMKDNARKTIIFQINNLSGNAPVTLSSCCLKYDLPSVILSDEHSVTRLGVETEILPTGKCDFFHRQHSESCYTFVNIQLH